MEQYLRLKVGRGIIQYLLASTNYTLKDIAILSNSSIKQIRAIYNGEDLFTHFSSELNLLDIYRVVLRFDQSPVSYKHIDKMN